MDYEKITAYENYLDERNEEINVGDKKVRYSVILRLCNHWDYMIGFMKWDKENAYRFLDQSDS